MNGQNRAQIPPPHRLVGRGEAWALVGALFYALNNVFSGMATRAYPLNSFLGAALRALPMLVVSLVFGFVVRHGAARTASPIAERRVFGSLVVSGLLVYVIGGPLLFTALREGGVPITTPIIGTQVLWSAIIAAAWLKQPLNGRMVIGMIAGVVGVTVLTLGRAGVAQMGPRWWLAVPYALGAALSWSSSAVVVASAMERGVDRFQVLAISALTGVLGLNACLWLTGDLGVWVQTPPRVLLQVIVAGVLGMAGLLSFTSALSMTTVASANALNSLQVGLAPLIAWLLVGEALNAAMAAGIVLVMAGVIVVQVSKPARTAGQDANSGAKRG